MNNIFIIQSPDGKEMNLPQLTEAQMREVDRIAAEEFGLGILQMMENAGRNLAMLAVQWFDELGESILEKNIVVVVGSGGNGGGGLCAARHLHNRGVKVSVILTRSVDQLQGAAKSQWEILVASGVHPTRVEDAEKILFEGDLILDALIGYSLNGAPRGATKNLIKAVNSSGKPVISLDIPSGIDATSGATPGEYVRAEQTLTLALPKAGLVHPACGRLFLADIGIPPEVYHPLGIHVDLFFGKEFMLPVEIVEIKPKKQG